ncbi:interleukin-12 subunit alpha-like [Kryptolebias marmoratus]|uniref:interleukin-12 subunit alpha-like n=1 Tax=Kryptolebias marmoratus TaxID=37003 RepID=UPI0007F8A6CE|nr:interleukin-12 subunit alpha-like [Kryptolebias marmoratus]
MLLIKLYFTAALMVLALSSPVLQVRRSLPEAGSCVEHAGTLLRNITDALTQTKLFSGLDCTKQNMELNLETSTPSVCSPQESTCSGSTKSEFDKESCLTNIGKDLTHYYKVLSAQPDPDRVLGSSVLHSLRQLMENCFMESLPTNLVVKEAAADRQSTFGERLSLCKVLRGFQVRTITINRAISYMNSSEHFQ